MGALSPVHMALVFIIALLVFGPKKLPEIGRELGKAIREFKKVSREVMESFHEAADDRTYPTPNYDAFTTPSYPVRDYQSESAGVVARSGEASSAPEAGHPSEAAPAGTVSRSPGDLSHAELSGPLHPVSETAEAPSPAGHPAEPERDAAKSPERIS